MKMIPQYLPDIYMILVLFQGVKEKAKLLFWEVIDGLCLEIGQEVKRDVVDPLMDFSLSVYDSVSTEVVTKFVL